MTTYTAVVNTPVELNPANDMSRTVTLPVGTQVEIDPDQTVLVVKDLATGRKYWGTHNTWHLKMYT